MANRGPGSAQRSTLLGRHAECALLDGLVAAIRQREGRSFVLRGKAGRGKTALLQYLIESASDLTVVRAAGAESEMQLAYVSLHQFCAPLLGRVSRAAGAERVNRDLFSVDVRGIEAPADWDDMGSGETYLGYARATNFASPAAHRGIGRRQTRYQIPCTSTVGRSRGIGRLEARRPCSTRPQAGSRTASTRGTFTS